MANALNKQTLAWACIDAEREQWALGIIAGDEIQNILATVEPKAGRWAAIVGAGPGAFVTSSEPSRMLAMASAVTELRARRAAGLAVGR